MTTTSVVVPAYDEVETIGATLDSLRGQSTEVIVVTGTAETRRIAADHDVVDVVVSGSGNGTGAARNRGAERALGDIVLFTDADTRVPDDWVETHRRHYTDPDVVGVGGPATALEGSLKDDILFKLLSDYWYRVSWPLGFVQQPGFNCSFRYSDFREVGGFDEEIPFMEDTELSLRMKERGEIVYDPATEVATSPRREVEEGYLSLFATYARAYTSYYLLGRDLRGEYFHND
ncbi:glycosyltransferase [Halarchaeum sp. P4]|uniref:glycosyltransferase n=1 Tax=Halarchaeum sp. P4 TaxID=3421639 RepID=UPI003EBF85D3